MCIRIRHASLIATPYDDERQIITIPAGLSGPQQLIAVRAVLTELAIPQPRTGGALCWCGAVISLLPRIPQQRTTEEAIVRGA